jgi:hypothetical protein
MHCDMVEAWRGVLSPGKESGRYFDLDINMHVKIRELIIQPNTPLIYFVNSSIHRLAKVSVSLGVFLIGVNRTSLSSA